MQTARCPQCRSNADVPDTYSHGDTLSCNVCHFQLRVLRSDKGALRLVVADAAPLRDQVSFNRVQLDRLQSELREARASFGIGANGFGVGVVYLVSRIALEERNLDLALALEALAVAVAVGIGLELANHFFLKKRKAIERIGGDIAQLREDQKHLQSLIREAERAQQMLHSQSQRPA